MFYKCVSSYEDIIYANYSLSKIICWYWVFSWQVSPFYSDAHNFMAVSIRAGRFSGRHRRAVTIGDWRLSVHIAFRFLRNEQYTTQRHSANSWNHKQPLSHE